jgi:hypothetical protein
MDYFVIAYCDKDDAWEGPVGNQKLVKDKIHVYIMNYRSEDFPAGLFDGCPDFFSEGEASLTLQKMIDDSKSSHWSKKDAKECKLGVYKIPVEARITIEKALVIVEKCDCNTIKIRRDEIKDLRNRAYALIDESILEQMGEADV